MHKLTTFQMPKIMPEYLHLIRVKQDNGMKRLHIISAALKVGGLIISMPAPARHGDLLKPLYEHLECQFVVQPNEQGFLDSQGVFREREQAKHIARDAGQLLPIASPSKDLFSEDLW